MKLICEYLENTIESLIVEEGGKKKLYIEGIYMESAKVNRNKRLYPTDILTDAVTKYIEEEVNTKGAIGELNHPVNPIPDPGMASHRIIKLEAQGTDFIGKAVVLNTPRGNIVRGLLEDDVRLGVSSRGLGTVKESKGINEVQKGYALKCVDVVHNPSAINAFVNGIMEGVEYLIDGSTITHEAADRIEQMIKQTPAKDLWEAKFRAFNYAMNHLAGSK